MSRLLTCALPGSVLSVALLIASGVESPAQAAVRWGACGKAEPIAGKGVSCPNGFSYNFTVTAPSQNWVVKLTVPLTQCAPVRFDVELDGKKVGSTAVLAGGKSEIVKLSHTLSAGAHVATVKVQFLYGGCFTKEPPITPSTWGVDAFVAVKPK